MDINQFLSPHFQLWEFLPKRVVRKVTSDNPLVKLYLKPTERVRYNAKAQTATIYSIDGVTPEIYVNLKRLALALEQVRSWLGDRSMTVTSGFRSMADHLRIYAAKGITDKRKIPMGSFHLKGLAADFSVAGLSGSAARRIIDPFWKGGMELNTEHVHLDLRTEPPFRFPP